MSSLRFVDDFEILNYDENESTISKNEVLSQIETNQLSYIVSDVDEEMLLLIAFKKQIDLQAITIYAQQATQENINDDVDISPPKQIYIYKRDKDIDINFDHVSSIKPDISIKCTSKKLNNYKGQIIKLQKQSKNILKFQKIQYLVVYIKSNQNDTEQTYFNNISFKINAEKDTEYFKPAKSDDTKNNDEQQELAPDFPLNENIAALDCSYLLQIPIETATNDKNKCDLGSCDALVTVVSVLTKYQVFVNQQQESKNNTSDSLPVSLSDNYDDISVLNNFHHLLLCHNHQFEEMYNIFKQKCNDCHDCVLSECNIIRRHYRDRVPLRANSNALKLLYCVDGDGDIHDIITQQLLDKIHCYYFHTFDIGYKLTLDSKQEIMNNGMNDDRKAPDDITYDRISEGIRKQLDNASKSRKLIEGLRRGNRVCKENKFKMEVEQQHELIYDYGIRYFYWEYYKNKESMYDEAIHYDDDQPPNEKYKVKDWYITSNFDNLKDEMINNYICTISNTQWNGVYQIAMRHLQTEYVKTITCSGKNRESIYRIKENDPIAVGHIIAMLIYCGFDSLSTKFSETYRRIPYNESDFNLKQRHKNYVHLGRLLREFVECFGNGPALTCTSLWNFKIYHGISVNAQFASIKAVIKGPTSTTTDYLVAVNFCGNEGMILELAMYTGWNYHESAMTRNAFVNCIWLSDFVNEQEIFFIGGWRAFFFNTIIERCSAINYQIYIDGMRTFANAISSEALYIYYHSTETTLKVTFRLLSHQLYKYYGTDKQKKYHKFKSLSKYADKLLTNYCRSVKQMNFWGQGINMTFQAVPNFLERLRNMIRFLFFYDYGWIKLNAITTIFPSVTEIWLGQQFNGLKIITNPNSMKSMEAFLKNAILTELKFISIDLGTLDDENCKSIATAVISKCVEIFKYKNWAIQLGTINKRQALFLFEYGYRSPSVTYKGV